jgi:hypothetical protein
LHEWIKRYGENSNQHQVVSMPGSGSLKVNAASKINVFLVS